MTLRRANGVPQISFDYALLQPKVAEQARAIAARVRKRIHESIGVIVDVGHDLIEAKDHLSHGQFGRWVQLEFGWTRRTAANYMSVATQLGPKRELISHLDIAPTAAYLLAAPSTPPECRDEAIQLAQKGTRITPAVVRKLVTIHRKKARQVRTEPLEKDRLALQLKLMLHRIRDRWDPEQLETLAKVLIRFAGSLNKKGGGQPSRGRCKAE